MMDELKAEERERWSDSAAQTEDVLRVLSREELGRLAAAIDEEFWRRADLDAEPSVDASLPRSLPPARGRRGDEAG